MAGNRRVSGGAKGATGATGPSGTPWTQIVVTHAQLQAAALLNDIEIYSLPALAVIHAVKLKPVAIFAAPGLGSYYLSVGVAGALASLSPQYDVFLNAPAGPVMQLSPVLFSGSNTVATSIRLAADADVLLNLSTGGSVIVSLWTSTAY